MNSNRFEIAEKSCLQSIYGSIMKKLTNRFGERESVRENDLCHILNPLRTSLENMERLYERKSHIKDVLSGFSDLDSITGGFQNSDLIIVAGWPSMGKTAFALNIAMNAAIDSRKPTAIFPLNMSREEIALRILCSEADVKLKSARTGFLTVEDWGRVTLSVGRIADSPLYVDDKQAISTSDIRSKVHHLQKEGKDLGLIIVDHLQLMTRPTRSDSRGKEMSDISRSLKALAKELDIPIIVASQLKRKIDDGPDRRPQLTDLRDMGAIEQDADVVIFIYRNEVYRKIEDDSQRGETEIIIAKQLNGPLGTAIIRFDPNCCTFRRHEPDKDVQIDDPVKPTILKRFLSRLSPKTR